jgi:hypothetical protein
MFNLEASKYSVAGFQWCCLKFPSRECLLCNLAGSLKPLVYLEGGLLKKKFKGKSEKSYALLSLL